jgi:RNA 3'-terminal phosphate cyclase (ATP)
LFELKVLRNASAYACIQRKPVQISNIRGKRPVPGLKQQHVSGLQLLEKISRGELEGGRVQSSEILLRPGKEGIMDAEFISDQGGGGYVKKKKNNPHFFFLFILVCFLMIT